MIEQCHVSCVGVTLTDRPELSHFSFSRMALDSAANSLEAVDH